MSILNESTQNQIDDLEKKMTPIQQMIISLRPRKKFSLMDYLPDFDYDNEINLNDNDNQFSSAGIETYENDNQESFSDKLFKQFDEEEPKKSTTDYPEEKDTNHSQSMTYNITSYLIVFVILIIHRIQHDRTMSL
jgi:hypothetical protein